MITIPTLSQLYTDIKSDLETQLGVTIPTFGKIFLRALAGVQAAKLKLYYLAIANLQKNIFVDTAEPEAIGGTLERFGRVKLNRNPFPAQAGQYTATVTGTIGATIPAGTTFKSDDDATNPGALFILDGAFTLTSSPDTITLRALEAGTDSKLSVSDTLTATAPIAGVDRTATVATESVTPLDAETTEAYRELALQAYRLEPQGGAASDYILWSADAQGVAAAYPYAKSGSANEIDLFIEATIADSTDGKGTPGALILAEVEDVIEFDPDTTRPLSERGRRPLGVFAVNVQAITVKEIDITVDDFVDLDTDKETAITNALDDAISLMRPFISGADIVSEKNDILDSNKIIQIILNAVPGASFGAITLNVDSAPLSTYTFSQGNIPHFNSVTINSI